MIKIDQRVGVFVDVQNMFYSAKNLFNKKVNFANILKDVVNKRKLIRAIAYVIKADELKEHTFFTALRKIGFEVKSKDLQIFIGGAKKGDWDVGIAMDMIELAPKLDTMILVSGDGDFVSLVNHLKHAVGCRVEVAAFGQTSSHSLREVADEFIDLEKNKKKYFMADKKK